MKLDGIDGDTRRVRVEIIAGHTTLQLLREIQTTMEENKIQPEQFEDRIIFMSMYNDIVLGKEETKDI